MVGEIAALVQRLSNVDRMIVRGLIRRLAGGDHTGWLESTII